MTLASYTRLFWAGLILCGAFFVFAVSLLLFGEGRWAALLGLCLLGATSMSSMGAFGLSARASKRSLANSRSVEQNQRLIEQLVESSQRATESLEQAQAHTSEQAGRSAEFARKALTRLRNDIPSLQTTVRTLHTAVSELQQQLVAAYREDAKSMTETLDAIAARLEQAERRMLGGYESDRLVHQDRWVQLTSLVQELTTSTDDSSAEMTELRSTVGRLGDGLGHLTSTLDDRESGAKDREDRAMKELDSALAQSRERLMSRIQVAVRDETRQAEALIQLMPKITPRSILPPSGRWAMDARALLHLITIVERYKPKTILELGGGTSTVWLGYLCEAQGGRVISVDHDETFGALTRTNLEKHELKNVAEVRIAPLVDVELDGTLHQWYSPQAFDDLSEVDLLVVDGPPGASSYEARGPALPYLHDKLSPRCIVVLDDAERDDERHVLESWRSTYPDFHPMDVGVSRLGILYKGNLK